MSYDLRSKRGTAKLSTEDAVRCTRLREEIWSRVHEMALIMGRTLGERPLPIQEFVLNAGDGKRPEGTSALRVLAPAAAPTGKVEIITWGCVCHTNKVCCADPDCPPCPV